MGTRLLEMNPQLYVNSRPHANHPNSDWREAMTIMHNIKNELNWEDATLKELYSTMNHRQRQNWNNKWARLLLREKRCVVLLHKRHHNAYKCGEWLSINNGVRPNQIYKCKLCRRGSDNIQHLLNESSFSKELWAKANQRRRTKFTAMYK